MAFDPYSTGVLVKEHHERLVADLHNYARDAGIAPRWLWTPMAEECGLQEIEYAKQFKQYRLNGKVSGLVYIRSAQDETPIEPRMSALTGVLVRNFIRARMMTLGTVLDLCASGEPPDATCLLIPNFFLSKKEGGTIASWQVSALYDLLVKRQLTGLQTVLCVSSLKDMRNEYGLAFGSLIESNYIAVEV